MYFPFGTNTTAQINAHMVKLVVRETKGKKNKLSTRNVEYSSSRDQHIDKLSTQSLVFTEGTGVGHLAGNKHRFCNSLISSDLTFKCRSQQGQPKKQMWRHRSESCVRYKR